MAGDGSFPMAPGSSYRHRKGRNVSLFLPTGPDGSRGGGGGGTPSKRENGGATRGRPDRYLINERKKDPAEVGQVLDVSWWPLPELNWGHEDFQSSALPSELKGHRSGAPIVADLGGGCQAAVRAFSWTTIVLQTLSCSPRTRRSKAAHR